MSAVDMTMVLREMSRFFEGHEVRLLLRSGKVFMGLLEVVDDEVTSLRERIDYLGPLGYAKVPTHVRTASIDAVWLKEDD